MNDHMTQALREIMGDRPGTVQLTESDRHRLLLAERRRVVLDVLSERLTPMSVDKPADAVEAKETGTDASVEQSVHRVRVSLHHAHLPKMADMDVIDYDPDLQRIE